MASQKPKRPSMLTRQRQLRAQQQQVKQSASKRLPSSGNSSANSNQARGQRADTMKQQATRNQQVVARGTQRMINRLNAQDKLDRAAAGSGPSGTTRTAGAGGVLGKPAPSSITTRKPSTGSGKPALPPGKPGGALAKRTETKTVKAQTKPPTQRGGAIEKAGPTIDVKANTPKMGGGRPSGNGSTRPALPGGRAGSALRGAGLVTLPYMIPGFGEQRDANARFVRQMADNVFKGTRTGTASGRTGRGGTTADQRQGTAKPKPAPVADYRDAQGNLYDGNTGRLKQAAPKASRPSPTQSRSGSTPNRGGGGGGAVSASSRSTRPTAGTSMPQAVVNPPKPFNPNRGTSKSDNPLLDREGGYLRNKMKDREAAAQAEQASKVGNKFDTKSETYTPTTKVDGSQYADKKPDMKKVSEYDRRKRRYYD